MHKHIIFKFIAILLCAASLLGAVAGGIGLFFLLEIDGFSRSSQDILEQRTQDYLPWLASEVAHYYAATQLGNCPEDLQAWIGLDEPGLSIAQPGKWYCMVLDAQSNLLATYGTPQTDYRYAALEQSVTYISVTGVSDTLPWEEDGRQYGPYQMMRHAETDQTVFIGLDADTGSNLYYTVEENTQSPVFTLRFHYAPDAFLSDDWPILVFLMAHREALIGAFAASVLLFAITLVYLCCVAGRKPGSDEAAPAGLNRLPLDLYGFLAGFAALLFIAISSDLSYSFPTDRAPFWALLGAGGFGVSLMITGLLFACAAQFKMKDGYWLRHTLTVICCILCWKAAVWCWNIFAALCKWTWSWLPGLIKKVLLFFWRLWLCIWRGFAGLMKKLWKLTLGFFSLLPHTWQWLLTACVLLFLLLLAFADGGNGLSVLFVLVAVVIVLYGASCFGILLGRTKAMRQGDLDSQVSDQFLVGSFKDFAGELNGLKEVVSTAAQKQMRSERMKAELITNVSHDIKTPLTSIINYVDLLHSAETEQQRQEYLQVLQRQSQQMKKLIEDLMELSKASTGNMTVDLRKVDAAEAIAQALGEFSDKLEAKELTVVYKAPEKPVYIKADGRLTWRVLNNLLSNAVKYALPGTRVYLDLEASDRQVAISLKNISAEPLNISAGELLERFVRGDVSRNTEGSGLGLNIAQNLMELQRGKLELTVDGDLFKVTLSFPACCDGE